MGRPKGLRKGPDGKWYMSEQSKPEPKKKRTLADTLDLPEKQAKRIVKGAEKTFKESKPMRIVEPRYKRNDIVLADNQAGLVLGYEGTKLVVQLLDGRTRLTLDESRAMPRQDGAL